MSLSFNDDGLITDYSLRLFGDSERDPQVSSTQEPQNEIPQDTYGYEPGEDSEFTALEFYEEFTYSDCGKDDKFYGKIKRHVGFNEDKYVGNVENNMYEKTPKSEYRQYEDEPSLFVEDEIQGGATTSGRYEDHADIGFFAVKMRRPSGSKNKRVATGTIIVPMTLSRMIKKIKPKRVSDGKTPKRI